MTYRFAHFALHARPLILTAGKRTVPLPRKAVETLSVLLARAGSVVGKEELLSALWPDGFVEESNLTQYVYLLRRTFREYGLDGAIETLPRRGYRFVLPVSESPRTASFGRRALAAAALIALAVTGGASSPLAKAGLTGEAARLYAMGRYYWNLRTSASMLHSVTYFERVVALAPLSPLGYAGLADAFTELSDSCDTRQCMLWSARAERTARKAAEIDPDSAEADTSLAMVTRLFSHDEVAATTLFRRAIERDRGYALAHEWYGNLLLAQGALPAARRELELAASLEPVATATYAWLARNCYYERAYPDSERYAKEALSLTPHRTETTVVLGLTYEAQGRFAEAAAVFRQLHRFADPNDADVLAAPLYARDGRVALSLAILKRNAARFSQNRYLAKDIILAYVSLHAYDAALKYLTRLQFESAMDRQFFRMDPRLDPIRRDPRFAAFI